ncbi:hypothetical protein [Streptomyces malaysiensis]|uniref:hypothetical protein n=1 Tax=Streptomyces malaysiensis TaxID=92644 RepID=UPI0011E4D033|nr:hypothetical protein [Streptomyces autolyticus]
MAGTEHLPPHVLGQLRGVDDLWVERHQQLAALALGPERIGVRYVAGDVLGVDLGLDLGVVGGTVGKHLRPRLGGERLDGGGLLAVLEDAAVGGEGEGDAVERALLDLAGRGRSGPEVDVGPGRAGADAAET